MTRIHRSLIVSAALACSGGLFAGCTAHGHAQEESGAPPPSVVESIEAGSVANVEHPERFPLAPAERYVTRSALSVTGVVANDVSRAVPVMALASGRAIDVLVRLGDEVKQGQLLMRVKSPDISAGFSDYRHAVADETLARAQLDARQTPVRARGHPAEGSRGCAGRRGQGDGRRADGGGTSARPGRGSR